MRGWRVVSEPQAVRFTVHGAAQPKGNMRGFVVNGHAIVTEGKTSSSKSWQRLVADEAQRHAPAGGPLDGPLVADVVFYLPRPASEPATLATLPDRKPDLDKLLRGLLDSLRNVIITDDARIVDFYRLRKLYSLRPRVEVAVWQARAEDLPPVEEAAAEMGAGPVTAETQEVIC